MLAAIVATCLGLQLLQLSQADLVGLGFGGLGSARLWGRAIMLSRATLLQAVAGRRWQAGSGVGALGRAQPHQGRQAGRQAGRQVSSDKPFIINV